MFPQAQTNGVGRIGTDPLPDRQSVMLQRLEGLSPSFTAMYVCAIGQVQPMIQLHAQTLPVRTLARKFSERTRVVQKPSLLCSFCFGGGTLLPRLLYRPATALALEDFHDLRKILR